MSKVFVYWDNSNVFIGARDVAEEREGRLARHRIRIDFKAMMRLAHADRPVEKAIAAGSVPPELRALWNRLEGAGVQVELFDRGAVERGEQQAPTVFCSCRCCAILRITTVIRASSFC